MLHLLQIKANQFHADLLAGTPSQEGGSQPARRFLLWERGFLYRVCLLLRERRAARRPSRACLICCPRCTSSAAKTTSPVALLTRAMSCVVIAGSSIMR